MSIGSEAAYNKKSVVGQNRMEMLMFRLNSKQVYGINVFKVREVTQCPDLVIMPNTHQVITGIADFRGTTIPVIDFDLAIGGPGIDNYADALIIISEFNREVQALMVKSVERIVTVNWEQVKPTPAGSRGRNGNYLTAVTEIDGNIIEIVDVERILENINPCIKEVSEEVKQDLKIEEDEQKHIVLIVDDSSVARNQLVRCMKSIDVDTITCNDGKMALDFLTGLANENKVVEQEVLMVISDVEMPVMDGYTLTTHIREHPQLSKLHVILHTSLSGIFNEALVKKVGADNFIPKFQPDVLAVEVGKAIEERKNRSE